MTTEQMKRIFAAGVLALVLALGAGGAALAQDDVTPITTEVETDDGFDWGWLGLLGLIGLAGLRGGTRDDTTVRRDATRTDTKKR